MERQTRVETIMDSFSRTTVSFKPDKNFLQAYSGWVLYINEVVPRELLKYIDTNEVRIGVSTATGKITASTHIDELLNKNKVKLK